MEFAYDHVLIESSSPAEEIGVHTAAACAENEMRRYTYYNYSVGLFRLDLKVIITDVEVQQKVL